jgi:hypothetical protein
MDEEQQTPATEPTFDFANPTEALTLDSGAAVLAQSMRAERDRAPDGRFKGAEKAETEADPENKVVDLKTGKPPEKAEEPAKAEADEDEDLEFEFPPEEDGKEPVRRKLSELVEGYDKASVLEKEVTELRSRANEVPVEYATGLEETVKARAQYMRSLEYVSKLFNPVAPNVAMLDPNHPNYDPDGYRAAYQAFEQSKKATEQIRADYETAAKEQREQQGVLLKAHLAKEQAALYKAWPEAKNPEVAKKVREDVARHYGFTDQEIGATTDHRMFLVLRDALELRASKAKQAEAVKVVRQKPKLVKGAARTTTDSKATGRSTAMRSLAQTGNARDAAAALKGLI